MQRTSPLNAIALALIALFLCLLAGLALQDATVGVVCALIVIAIATAYFVRQASIIPGQTHDGSHLMHLARREALKRGHPAFGVEHLVRALILDPIGATLLTRAGVDVARLDAALVDWMQTAFQPPGAAPHQELHYRQGAQRPVVFHHPPTPAPAMRDAWRKAQTRTEGMGPPTVEALVSAARESSTIAASLLATHGLTRKSLAAALRGGHTDALAGAPSPRGLPSPAHARATADPRAPRVRVMLRWAAGGNLDAVIDVLIEELGLDDAEATRLALQAQDTGESRVATLPTEDAKARVENAQRRAHELGQPMNFVMFPAL